MMRPKLLLYRHPSIEPQKDRGMSSSSTKLARILKQSTKGNTSISSDNSIHRIHTATIVTCTAAAAIFNYDATQKEGRTDTMI